MRAWFEKHGKIGEILRFCITGVTCFLIEFACLVALKEWLKLDVLIATPIAFAVSVAVNYILCVLWVFKSAGHAGNKERLLFIATSIVGLVLNEVFMWLFGILWGQEKILFTLAGKNISMYMLNKVLSTLLVFVWNYISKSKVLNKRSNTK